MPREGSPEYVHMAELWEEALDEQENVLKQLRTIYPSYMYLMAETGHEAIKDAMDNAQNALAKLHRAGRYILTQEEYDAWLANRLAIENVLGITNKGEI